MSDLENHTEIDKGSDKNFGIVFGIVFVIVGIYPLSIGEDVFAWALVLGSVIFVVAYISPRLLRIPNRLWFGFGVFVGRVVGPVILVLIYSLTVLPIGIIARVLRKDLINQRIDKNSESYWITREDAYRSMKDQF